MAIRLRTVGGIRVALCAVETDYMPGDVYLNDADHHALSNKFALDWQSMGFISDPPVDERVVKAMESQRLRDAKEELLNWLESAQ